MTRWLLLLIVFACAAANLLELFAQAYALRAAEAGVANPGNPQDNPVSLEASRIAVRLTPWQAERRADYAWRLQQHAEPLSAGRELLEALRWAPADAYRWLELERLLLEQLDTGPMTEQASVMANRLAPHSPTIQAENTRLGLRHWVQGSQLLQEQWLISMQFMLGRDRRAFLDPVAASRRQRIFCLGPAPGLGLSDWCKAQRGR